MIRSIHHICIETDNYRESIDFYTGMLEFSIIEETENFHGREFNTWIKKENIIIELQTPKNAESADSVLDNVQYNKTGIVHVCFLVDNLKDSIDLLLEKGFTQFRRKDGEIIYNVKEGYLAKIIAPEGTIIELREG